MSYDIALRRTISGSVARDDAEGGRTSPGDVGLERGLLLPALLGAAASVADTLLVLNLGRTGKIGKRVERASYRATWRDLAATQEAPAVTMRELVYGKERLP